MRNILLFLFGLLSLTLTVEAQVDVSGATVGNGSYATLGAAFTAINGDPQTSAVIIIGISANTDEGATTATLNAGAWTSMTISPTGGAPRTITGAPAGGSPLIDFSGADNVTIDGLNSGGNSLTIANTTISNTTATSTIRFIGGATGNTITRCSIQGSGTMSVATNGAVIFFSTDAVTANGNDNNTISNCDIGPAGSNLPTKCILGNGSTSTTAIGNSGIVISNNDIHDYFGVAVTSAGVATNGGCNNWTVTGNRFYQSAPRTWTTGAVHNAILMGPSTATSGMQGAIITNNIIGYASNSQTGTYTLSGLTGSFRVIHLTAISGGTLNRISNNTIASISLTGVTSSGTSTSSPFVMILANSGLTNVDSNTIGSQSATGSLTYSTTTTTATDVYGIYNFGSNDWNVRNNNIGGISASNAGATGAFIVYGIRGNTGASVAYVASDNLIGGTVANSIQNNSVSTTSQLFGLQAATGNCTWTNNIIRNLTGAGGTGTGTTASVIGMATSAASSSNHTITNNLVHTLSNTSAAGAVTVTGLIFGSSSGTNTIERNFIHSLSVVSSSATATLNGISVNSGTATYKNNMIRLGVDASGSSITAGCVINGINEQVAGTDNFYNNSVYIGGTGVVTTASNTYAFVSTITTNTRSYRNNIFWNARSNSTSTGKHYAIRVGGTTVNPTGLTSDFNVLYANGTGGTFGFYNLLDVANIAAWRSATGQDNSSISGYDPQFIAPNGDASTVNLHIHASNPTVVEGSGVLIAGVTDDYDGQTRSGLTPTDIGADAGNFVLQDVVGPAISYTALGNSSGLLTRSVTNIIITDGTGVNTTSGTRPRLYYKKSTDANAFLGNTAGDNGWKWVEANGTSSPFDFTIDYSLIFGGTVVPSDVIQYFFVAQDIVGPYVSASPSAGFSGTSVSSISSAPTVPASYTIAAAYTGTYTVGNNVIYNYLTLKAAFDALNAGAITGNITLEIQTEGTTETATAVLNALNYEGGTYTVTIKPAVGTAPVITGSLATAIIQLNGADNVIIDGSNAVSGTTRDLIISNTSTSGLGAVWLSSAGVGNGATNNVVKNCNISCGTNQVTGSTASIAIYSGGSSIAIGTGGADNDNNTFTNNYITQARYGIFSIGVSSANPNSGTVISQNLIGPAAFGITEIGKGGIVLANETNATISQNEVRFIGGDFANTTAGTDRSGISLATDAAWTPTTTFVTNTTVTRNLIHDVIEERTFSASGIVIAGTDGANNTSNVITNNMIYNVKANGTSPDQLVGIGISSGKGDIVAYNSVYLYGDVDPNPAATASSINGYGISLSASTPTNLTLKNNIVLLDIFSSSTPALQFAAFNIPTSYTWGTGSSNYNDFYYNPSTTVDKVGCIGGSGGTFYADLAAWQSAATQDANSVSQNPVFNSSTDLHLNTAVTPYFLTGSPVGGVTVDYDGDTRSGTFPFMGADEVTGSPLPVELSAFTAVNKNRIVVLNWETKSELNTSHFIVERSIDEKAWINAGSVKASGNSNVNVKYSFTDSKLISGKYSYRLKIVDKDGRSTLSDVVNAEVGTPTDYALSQNYPNPFNPSTRIDYQLPVDARVTVELYSISGEKVATLVNNQQSAGYYTLDVNGSVRNLASGVYIYRMNAVDVSGKNFVSVKKMMMLK